MKPPIWSILGAIAGYSLCRLQYAAKLQQAWHMNQQITWRSDLIAQNSRQIETAFNQYAANSEKNRSKLPPD